MSALGSYRLRCVRPGGVVLAQYHDYTLAQDSEIDLLDQSLSTTIRFSQFESADVACKDSGFELARRIAAGDLVVVETTSPEE